MASRDEIVSHCNDLLDAASFADYGPNGLQVHGAADVNHIATAVSCTLDIFERAAAAGAQLLLTHHGLFWKGDRQVIDAHQRARLAALFTADLNLVAYHLPLDAHPTLGNNVLLRTGLGLGDGGPFGDSSAGRALGTMGVYDEPLPWQTFLDRVETLVERAPLALGAEPAAVRSVAICSGGGGSFLRQAIERGADVLLTGEPKEGSRAQAAEGGIAYVAAGHYATETFGVRALGEHLASTFGVAHTFLPDANPV